MSKFEPRYYVLDADGNPKQVSDVLEWAALYGERQELRRLGYYEREGYRVSTVFLGLDHNFRGKGPPLLYETMVFDDVREIREGFSKLYRTHGDEQLCERYSTRDDALIGHERHVKQLDRMLDYARDAVSQITNSCSVDSDTSKE